MLAFKLNTETGRSSFFFILEKASMIINFVKLVNFESWTIGQDAASVPCLNMASFLHYKAANSTIDCVYMFFAMSLTHRDYSSFSKSFGHVMHSR